MGVHSCWNASFLLHYCEGTAVLSWYPQVQSFSKITSPVLAAGALKCPWWRVDVPLPSWWGLSMLFWWKHQPATRLVFLPSGRGWTVDFLYSQKTKGTGFFLKLVHLPSKSWNRSRSGLAEAYMPELSPYSLSPGGWVSAGLAFA